MNAADITALKRHGYIFDSSSISDDSGKSDFDEEYYALKPPPTKANKTDNVIKVFPKRTFEEHVQDNNTLTLTRQLSVLKPSEQNLNLTDRSTFANVPVSSSSSKTTTFKKPKPVSPFNGQEGNSKINKAAASPNKRNGAAKKNNRNRYRTSSNSRYPARNEYIPNKINNEKRKRNSSTSNLNHSSTNTNTSNSWKPISSVRSIDATKIKEKLNSKNAINLNSNLNKFVHSSDKGSVLSSPSTSEGLNPQHLDWQPISLITNVKDTNRSSGTNKLVHSQVNNKPNTRNASTSSLSFASARIERNTSDFSTHPTASQSNVGVTTKTEKKLNILVPSTPTNNFYWEPISLTTNVKGASNLGEKSNSGVSTSNISTSRRFSEPAKSTYAITVRRNLRSSGTNELEHSEVNNEPNRRNSSNSILSSASAKARTNTSNSSMQPPSSHSYVDITPKTEKKFGNGINTTDLSSSVIIPSSRKETNNIPSDRKLNSSSGRPLHLDLHSTIIREPTKSRTNKLVHSEVKNETNGKMTFTSALSSASGSARTYTSDHSWQPISSVGVTPKTEEKLNKINISEVFPNSKNLNQNLPTKSRNVPTSSNINKHLAENKGKDFNFLEVYNTRRFSDNFCSFPVGSTNRNNATSTSIAGSSDMLFQNKENFDDNNHRTSKNPVERTSRDRGYIDIDQQTNVNVVTTKPIYTKINLNETSVNPSVITPDTSNADSANNSNTVLFQNPQSNSFLDFLRCIFCC